ncbi:MAG: hypothetical protein P8183_13410 [Anaerolineae bacterium]|jgi:hypothetical protein
MKKQTKPQNEPEDILPEYDFSQMGDGERGKYYEAYRAGHTVRIMKEDGDVEVHYFTLEEGAVVLEPDVREYFPDSESVNEALRNLIALIPKRRKAANSA